MRSVPTRGGGWVISQRANIRNRRTHPLPRGGTDLILYVSPLQAMAFEPDNLKLRGRVALVTGGSRGIGRATVERLADLDAHVVVNYLNGVAAANATVTSAQGKGVEAIAVRADVANPLEAQNLIDAAVQHFQRLDILICNAGIWEGAPVEALSEELWDR